MALNAIFPFPINNYCLLNIFKFCNICYIGEKYDTVELARLLQLILGCAVNCRNAQGE